MGEVALGETNPVAMAPIATAAVPVIHNQVSFIHTDNGSFNQNCYREFFPQGNSPNCNHCPNMGFLGASATRISPPSKLVEMKKMTGGTACVPPYAIYLSHDYSKKKSLLKSC